jgi:hypothetical protein
VIDSQKVLYADGSFGLAVDSYVGFHPVVMCFCGQRSGFSSHGTADVIDHVVQREHLFLAQMRHMHPMVETYIQDLKATAPATPSPSKTIISWAGWI